MKQKTHKNCANPNCNKEFKLYNSTQKYCSYSCQLEVEGRKEKKVQKKINPISEKRKAEKPIYDLKRDAFLSLEKNKFCKVHGKNCTKIATTVEHRMGRRGFADDWARDNKISLYIDERFWLASCNPCNLELENNPELSYQFQLSKIHGGKKFK